MAKVNPLKTRSIRAKDIKVYQGVASRSLNLQDRQKIAQQILRQGYDWDDMVRPAQMPIRRGIDDKVVHLHELKEFNEIQLIVWYRALLRWCDDKNIEMPNYVENVFERAYVLQERYLGAKENFLKKELVFNSRNPKEKQLEELEQEKKDFRCFNIDDLTIRDYEGCVTNILWYVLSGNTSLERMGGVLKSGRTRTELELDKAQLWFPTEFIPEFREYLQQEIRGLLGWASLEGAPEPHPTEIPTAYVPPKEESNGGGISRWLPHFWG